MKHITEWVINRRLEWNNDINITTEDIVVEPVRSFSIQLIGGTTRKMLKRQYTEGTFENRQTNAYKKEEGVY